MTPVDIISTSVGVHSDEGAREARTCSTRARVSSKPASPVTALAHPLFVRTARTRASGPACCSAVVACTTGAARNAFVVNTPATEAGTLDTTSAISGLDIGTDDVPGLMAFLTPAYVLATR